MIQQVEQLFRFDLAEVISNLIKLGIAFVLALPVAWDRERSERQLGMRTFPLVAIGSCGFMLIGQSIVGDVPDAQARILQGVITGIGFLGGGAIVKQGLNVRGTATAAAIWTTAALGAAVSHRHYEIAVTLSVITFFILRWMRSLKHLLREEHETNLRAEEDAAQE